MLLIVRINLHCNMTTFSMLLLSMSTSSFSSRSMSSGILASWFVPRFSSTMFIHVLVSAHHDRYINNIAYPHTPYTGLTAILPCQPPQLFLSICYGPVYQNISHPLSHHPTMSFSDKRMDGWKEQHWRKST